MTGSARATFRLWGPALLGFASACGALRAAVPKATPGADARCAAIRASATFDPWDLPWDVPWDVSGAPAGPSAAPPGAPGGAADGLVALYQRHLRRPHVKGSGCRLRPTCSAFAREAIAKWRLGAVVLVADRLFVREHALMRSYLPACAGPAPPGGGAAVFDVFSRPLEDPVP